MAKRGISFIVTLLAVGLLLAACAGLQGNGYAPPPSHPGVEDLGQEPKVCTDCHEPGDGEVAFEKYVHSKEWGENHPVDRDAVCAMCHQTSYCNDCHARYVHSADYGVNHRVQAYQGDLICATCHQTSFCNDCHATRVELKPSVKNQAETYRPMPHRGDYLSRHRIDGRMDPTSCFRCHGNPKAAESCGRCHG